MIKDYLSRKDRVVVDGDDRKLFDKENGPVLMVKPGLQMLEVMKKNRSLLPPLVARRFNLEIDGKTVHFMDCKDRLIIFHPRSMNIRIK